MFYGGADILVRLVAMYSSTRFGSRVRSPRRTRMSAPPNDFQVGWFSRQHPHARVAGTFIRQRRQIERPLLPAFGPGDGDGDLADAEVALLGGASPLIA